MEWQDDLQGVIDSLEAAIKRIERSCISKDEQERLIEDLKEMMSEVHHMVPMTRTRSVKNLNKG